MKYRLSVTEWCAVSVEYVVEADSLDEAIEKAGNGDYCTIISDGSEPEVMERLVDSTPIGEPSP